MTTNPSPKTHPAALPPKQLERECRMRARRDQGPGGQHRNKVETAVEIEHLPTGVVAEATERRSQAANRQKALFRLRIRLALAVRSDRSAPSPSPLWKSRCRSGRIQINAEHDDFPAMLAEALDEIVGADWEMNVAAEGLGVSVSQLVKLLKKEPAALAKVNSIRKERGLRPLL
ncbi:MAG: peptide chain release factor-like protein [Planctomycetia bacterium]|jgi:hypothetical protein